MSHVDYRFTPATFGLYEFDDAGLATADGAPARRWFSSWQGPVGEPAEEVTLGWARGDTTVLVCTSGREYDDEYARFIAAHVALGGTALPFPGAPQGAAATLREMERIRDAVDAWFEVPGVPPGGSPARAIACNGFAVAYSLLATGALFIAAVGLAPDRFLVRDVRDWNAYDMDVSA